MKEPITAFQGAYRFLSNFAPCAVQYEGHWYRSTEAAYQAAKFPHLPDLQKQMRAATPGQTKRLSRTAERRPDWDDVKLGVMEHLLRQKFSIPGYQQQLLLTADAELIEGNTWNDTFWGVCRGRGQNNLGKLLMKIRAELQHGLPKSE